MVLSIHFPLTREDSQRILPHHRRYPFNPLPSHEGRPPRTILRQSILPFNPLPSHEGRLTTLMIGAKAVAFQSTSLSRGKTIQPRNTNHLHNSFNPLPSHEGRHHPGKEKTMKENLSIHFPLTREDRYDNHNRPGRILSIHFPLTREDERENLILYLPGLSIHFPLTREDCFVQTGNIADVLSIHFPLTREDLPLEDMSMEKGSFNPLPSHEGRREAEECGQGTKKSFNPLPSHEGRQDVCERKEEMKPFNPLPSHEGRLCPRSVSRCTPDLSIHFPLTREDVPTFPCSHL